jgi:Domain of unknown function (DUF1772)
MNNYSEQAGENVSSEKRKSCVYEWISWLTLLLLAQWFFGNLYEAVALVPNLMSIIEMKSGAGEALFKTKMASPVTYYVPSGTLALALVAVLTISGWLQRRPGTPYMISAAAFLIAGGGITFCVVQSISLPLFFKPQMDLRQASKLINKWRMLNYVRLLFAGASLIAVILWIRTIVRS